MAQDGDERLTTNTGAPIDDDQKTIATGRHGPPLPQDAHLAEKLPNYGRECTPERVVRARGASGFGRFKVTDEVTQCTCAAILSEIGKRTEVFARLSTVGGENSRPPEPATQSSARASSIRRNAIPPRSSRSRTWPGTSGH